MNILVTGGAGYIGSHTCIELLAAGHQVFILDNFSNSKRSTLARLEELAGCSIPWLDADVRNRSVLENLFAATKFDAVIHFAGLKAVGESVSDPLSYYDNNVQGSLVLFDVMQRFDVRKLVFSSSATVYGDPASVPIAENFPLSATNPYGRSKLMIEQILGDLYRADSRWSIALLRYFNPVGAHESGLIGEDPNGVPNNLVPYIAQVAQGRREQLSVFGRDYPTPDGTGIRDYIHVVDLAAGHVKTINRVLEDSAGLRVWNLGTGRGTSVLEMVRAFERVSGKDISLLFAPRRSGDIAQCYADVSLANRELNWVAVRDIDQMCRDAWRWQQTQASLNEH